jgi:hypothetical protein
MFLMLMENIKNQFVQFERDFTHFENIMKALLVDTNNTQYALFNYVRKNLPRNQKFYIDKMREDIKKKGDNLYDNLVLNPKMSKEPKCRFLVVYNGFEPYIDCHVNDNGPLFKICQYDRNKF